MFEDIKGVIGIRKSKKDKHHNGQMKRTHNDLQNIHIKLKIDYTNPTKHRGKLRCSGRIPAPLIV